MRVLTCVALGGGACQQEVVAQTAQLVGRQGRIEVSVDSVRGLYVAVRDDSGCKPRTRAILGFPSFTFSGGRRLVSHLIRMEQTQGKTPPRSASFKIYTAFAGNNNVGLSTLWRIRFLDGLDEGLSVSVELLNVGSRAAKIIGANTVTISTDARWLGADSSHSFWSFQGGTYPERPDWVFPLFPGFSRDNFQGMNAADYGGGIPVVDLWTRFGGMALASLARSPEQLALPVRVVENEGVRLGIEERNVSIVPPGGRIKLQPFVVIFHSGDFFSPLRTYYRLLMGNQFVGRPIPPAAYGAEWCGWGYERSFVPRQILATLPLARKLGVEWATIDDGYQNADGDWRLDQAKFPGGDRDMRSLVDSIHAHGLKAMLWWVPLEAHDSVYSATHFPGRMTEFGMNVQSSLARLHKDWFQLNADGTRTQVSWWNSYTLCPAVPAVREHYRQLVKRFVKVWGFDGFKIDGQNMNAVPPCYNPGHHHRSPLEAPRAVPEFFRDVTGEATSLNSDVVFYVCACGTNFSVYNLPYVTIPVAADPLSAWQVRHRAKAYKAMLGDAVPYCGDHVELTNRIWDEALHGFGIKGEEDFASTIGVGGVPATKFTAPGVLQADSSLMLDARKEERWKHWLDIYNRERLSSGKYLNLYDIAFDKPEGHVVARGDTMYFAFYAQGTFSGSIELRGLLQSRYRVMDYAHDRQVGETFGPVGNIDVTFVDALLLKAIPIDRQ